MNRNACPDLNIFVNKYLITQSLGIYLGSQVIKHLLALGTTKFHFLASFRTEFLQTSAGFLFCRRLQS